MAYCLRGDEGLTVEDVAALGAARLAEILLDHAHRDGELAQALRIALAASTSVAHLKATFDAEIEALRRDERMFNDLESRRLAREFDRVRDAIVRDLLPIEPEAAAILLGRLAPLDATGVFERADDSHGEVGDAIRQALIEAGRAWALVRDRDPNAVAVEVFDHVCNDDYGVRDGAIGAFAEALGDAGLNELERLIHEAAAHRASDKSRKEIAEARRALRHLADPET